ncbi:hypothetical protein [Necropsobacter massiliensis]|uniref:hypothetical protein n=1 Tax=Necropsobacter massiliensis TaxID=1400001 RepID=UPI000A4876C1|nr:hypothetical protein [Necropsobacter massiliensis]
MIKKLVAVALLSTFLTGCLLPWPGPHGGGGGPMMQQGGGAGGHGNGGGPR